MPAPRVDVGVVSWNTRELTLQAVQRALTSDPGLDVRVLVRDNGSTDGTVEALREQCPQALVQAGANVGFAAGVNTLVARSDAPWLLLLNSDAWPEPGALSELVAAAERAPRAALVAPRLLRPDGSVEPSVHPLPSVRTAAAGLLGRPAVEPSTEGPVGWAVGAAVLLRREALDDIGPWDERFFMYAEDLDYGWRARLRGWEVRYAPGAVVRHVGNASGQQRYGEERELVAIRNANTVVRERLGLVPGLLWQVLNAVAAARLAVVAARQGDPGRAAFWRRQVPAHLGRRP